MPKKAVSLEGLLDTSAKPTETGIPQRGSGELATPLKSIKREGEKRLTLALDGATYRRLRLHAVEVDQTHQDILDFHMGVGTIADGSAFEQFREQQRVLADALDRLLYQASQNRH